MHTLILNVVIMIIQYRTKDCTPEILSRLLESLQPVFLCRWAGKYEPISPQKFFFIIDGICYLCTLLIKKFTICIHSYNLLDPAKWKEMIDQIISQDLNFFFNDVKDFEKNAPDRKSVV